MDHVKTEQTAVERYEIIAPLLDKRLDPGAFRAKKAEICRQNGVSDRTIRRWLKCYHADGFSGLKPKDQEGKPSKVISQEILQEAILLRREVPSRSVQTIIQTLELEQHVSKGTIRRSTLQQYLMKAGFGTKQMSIYHQMNGAAARRYLKQFCNELWISDIKYGFPVNGKMTYLIVFMDDASRFIVHASFYPNQEQSAVESAFRDAVSKFGVPNSILFDNGVQYRTKAMARICAKLGTRLIYCRPYSPEAKGCVERVNRDMNSFLNEAQLEKIQSLERLNELFRGWLDTCYQNHPHSLLSKTNPVTPAEAYRNGPPAERRYLSEEEIHEAFLHCESRKVDKTGCISFRGRLYEAGLDLAGLRVDVLYRSDDTSVLRIESKDYKPREARELKMGPYTGGKPLLPERLTPLPADHSRVLDAIMRNQPPENNQPAVQAAERQDETKTTDAAEPQEQPVAVSYREEGKSYGV